MASTPETAQKAVKVLVVEDSPTQLEALRFLLEESGFSVVAATNGKEGLAAAKANATDLVISDIVMPEMDGYALCKALRVDETLRHLPVILLTSLTDPRDVIRGLESGANNFICKPYDDRALIARVQNVLANQEIRKAELSEMGINIVFAGQRFFITADRLQILDLLLSTYENAVNRNSEFIRTRDELRILNKQLEARVGERTAALVAEIEERKRAEAAVQRERKRFDDILENLPTMICLLAPDYHVPFANRYFREHFGEPRGRRCFEHIFRRTEPCPDCQSFTPLKTHAPHHWEWAAPDGSYLDIYDFPLTDVDGSPLILEIGFDVTEKKRIVAQLQRSQRLESIGTLASGLAHDLNNILAPIMMSISILREELSPAEREDILAVVEKNARRGAEMIKQLLTFGRGLAGEPVVLQLRHVIKDVVRIAGETFPKNITIGFKAPADLWPLIGDATQLHQVVLSLCINSRDAMPQGGTLSLSVENVRLDEEWARMNPQAKAGPYLRLQVSDTGCGIAPENLDRIFDPFFTTKAASQGTGLGLAMVLGIVKSHGGFVDVYSEVGRGTTFKVYLPTAREASPAAGEGAATSLPRGQEELILVVDDEDSICNALQYSLERQGYRALIARNGVEAWVLYERNRAAIKVVVTDLMMPVMDGFALIRALKKINAQVKLIASSGLADGANDSLLQDLKDLGVGKYLSKPYNLADLILALHEQLGK